MKKVFKLVFVRSTKNKHVYSDGEEGVMGAVYIPKDQLPEPAPSSIELAIITTES